MAEFEGVMWQWKAQNGGWNSTWPSPLHGPQWDPYALLLPGMQSPGWEREMAHSSHLCKTWMVTIQGKPKKKWCTHFVFLLETHLSLFVSFYLRCIQDPEIVVNVSKTMSMQYIPPELSEDCLYLNVYTPADVTPGDKLPVGEGHTAYKKTRTK